MDPRQIYNGLFDHFPDNLARAAELGRSYDAVGSKLRCMTTYSSWSMTELDRAH